MTAHLALVFVALPLLASAAEPIPLTQDEFKMYRYYRTALEHPDVVKMKADKRLAAIAKDGGFKAKDMAKAVERGEAAGDVEKKCEANIQEALGRTEVATRLGKLDVDASVPHAVAYVQWLNDNISQVEEEASLLAHHTANACPIISSIQVWANDKASPKTRVFQALISQSAAARINPERAKDFADTRYIRLFENVKNASAGDDLTTEQNTARKAQP